MGPVRRSGPGAGQAQIGQGGQGMGPGMGMQVLSAGGKAQGLNFDHVLHKLQVSSCASSPPLVDLPLITFGHQP